MDERLIQGILDRPDAAAIVAELRARVEARSYEQMPIAVRLVALEKLLVKAARSMRKGARMCPNDPLHPKFEEVHVRVRVLLREVRARRAEGR
jgi:hypothetical protein